MSEDQAPYEVASIAEARDPDMLLDSIRRHRVAAAAERRASKGRGFVVEVGCLEDGTVQLVVCDPAGDRAFEEQLAKHVMIGVLRALAESAAAPASEDAT